MKQLIIEILMKMAEMDIGTKELTAQVEAQSLLVAALLIQSKSDNSLTITQTVQEAIVTASASAGDFMLSDVNLLLTHVNRLLAVARMIEVQAMQN